MNPLEMILQRMIVFDNDSDAGSGGGNDEREVTMKPKEIKDELAQMFEGLPGTATPAKTAEDKISLDLDMSDPDTKDTKLKDAAGAQVTEPKEKGEEDAKTPEQKKVSGEKEQEEEGSKEKEDKQEKPADAAAIEVESIRQDFLNFASAQLGKAGITADESLVGEPAKTQEDKKPEEPVKPVPVPEPVTPQVTTPTVLKTINIDEETFDSIKNDRAKFATFLNDFGKSIADHVRSTVLIETIQANQKFSTQLISSVDSVNRFYAQNPALEPYRPVIGFISSTISQKNPELNRDQVLEETKKESYRLLRIKPGTPPPANGAPRDPSTPPTFAPGTTQRQEAPGVKQYKNKIAQELDEMRPKR